jgi:hypothetical protein
MDDRHRTDPDETGVSAGFASCREWACPPILVAKAIFGALLPIEKAKGLLYNESGKEGKAMITIDYSINGTEISISVSPTENEIEEYLGCDSEEAQAIVDDEYDGGDYPTIDELKEDDDFVAWLKDRHWNEAIAEAEDVSL